jgi:hypothetical protein
MRELMKNFSQIFSQKHKMYYLDQNDPIRNYEKSIRLSNISSHLSKKYEIRNLIIPQNDHM